MADVRRFDPSQKRDPDGKWGDGIPGPTAFDMEGFDLISRVEGTFGELEMGVDPAGDARLAWRDGSHDRAMDLSAGDVHDLSSALGRLAAERDQMGSDYATHDLVDEEWFGAQQEHKVELYGSGVISVVFGAEEDDPWTLLLDPPDGDGDDVQAFRDGLDDVLTEANRSAVQERKFNPGQPRDPGGEGGGQWVSAGGAAGSALKDVLKLADRISLQPGDSFAGSDTLSAAEGRVNLAWIDRGGQKYLRFGAGNVDFDEGHEKWRAANRGSTAELDPGATEALRGELDRMVDRAKQAHAEIKELDKKFDKFYAKHGDHPSGRDASEQWLAGLSPEAAAEYRDLQDDWDALVDEPAAQGGVYGAWGDVRYELQMSDDASWHLLIGVRPKDAPDDWELRDGVHDAWLSPAQVRQLGKKLGTAPASRSRNPKEALVFERYNDQHAPAGSANGGQFTSGGGGGQDKKPAPPKRPPDGPRKPRKPAHHGDSGTLSYDPHSNHGTGYDSKNGDPRVHDLQQALNRLGIKDSAGKALKDDGRLGPKTTSAVKALQTRLGLKPDGKVTPALLAQIKGMKSLPATKRRSAVMDFCVRSFGFEFEERARSSDGRTLEGYAAVFDSPTRIAAVGGDFDEVISRGAFTRSIRSRMPVLQFEHGRDPRVGAVPIGSIDDLAEDSRGLHVRATLFDNPVVEPVRQAIAGRAIKGMSFRFNVAENGDSWQRRSGALDLRTVGDADVHELGPVVFPAYDATTVSVRSLLAQLGPEEHLTLLRELAHDLRAVDLQDLTGQAGTRSAASGEFDAEQPGERQASTTSTEARFAADGDSLRLRGIL